jgi:hypothetical protein
VKKKLLLCLPADFLSLEKDKNRKQQHNSIEQQQGTNGTHKLEETVMKLSWHLHLHFALLDYLAATLAGCSILVAPHFMATTLFFPDIYPISVATVFTLQLFGFMLIVFGSHFAYHIHCTPITTNKIRAMLWLLFLGDLLHLFVYYRGQQMKLFKGGLYNPGVLPNVVISSYAAVSRLVYLLQPNKGLVLDWLGKKKTR